MAPHNHNTWLGYLNELSKKKFDPHQWNVEGIEKMFMVNSGFNSPFYYSIPTVYLLDYTTGKYIFMSESTRIILGYDSKEWSDIGISFTIDNYHKDDLKVFDEKIFPDRLQMSKKIPVNELPNHIFSYNYRMKNSKGEYVNLIQRNCFIKSDKNGLPLLSLGMIINIEHYKKENPVIQLVEKINADNTKSEIMYKKLYYLNDENTIFSKREREVLLWVTDGFTSKEIADKLFISEGTVINHRKNMILKSGAKNVAELISFAMGNYII